MERRLIDASELEAEFAGPFVQTYKDCREALRNAPTISAVEVVRCRECKHWDNSTTGNDPFFGTCKLAKYCVGANGYCVYGIRREPDDSKAD